MIEDNLQWHSSLTKTNRNDIERVQKAAVKVIMGKLYTTYKNGLEYLKIDTLDKRREKLCLHFPPLYTEYKTWYKKTNNAFEFFSTTLASPLGQRGERQGESVSLTTTITTSEVIQDEDRMMGLNIPGGQLVEIGKDKEFYRCMCWYKSTELLQD